MKNKGITLIALVITIIVMLILAGIAISLTIGENGIMRKAKESGVAYSEQAAREKLKLVLADLEIDKLTNSKYNEGTFIDDRLTKEGMSVVGDIVIVDGWQFEIDRSVPKIVTSIGKGDINEEIKIQAISKISNDYVTSIIEAKIHYKGTITSIQIGGENLSIPEAQGEIYTITKEVKANGLYHIIVKDEKGNYKIATIEITDITEDMDIWNKEDMQAFRDKVNSGRTFKERTVRVMADINLQGSESSQWIPIANYAENTSLSFLGIFEGNAHVISGLYINNNSNFQGLFGFNVGIIKNITVEGEIKGNGRIRGGITAHNLGKIENCHNQAKIMGKNSTENSIIGGIAGNSRGEIMHCSNKGEIIGQSSVAGIVANDLGGVIIEDCHNTGNITGTQLLGGISGHFGGIIRKCSNSGRIEIIDNISGSIGGIVGTSVGGTIEECYNIADVIGRGTSSYGGIVGSNLTINSIIRNCYNTGNIIGNFVNTYALGGISGYDEGGTVENCYNLGNVSGTIYNYGGITADKRNGSIKNCFNLGIVRGTTTNNVSAITSPQDATILECYYLQNGTPSTVGIAKATIQEMQTLMKQKLTGDKWKIDPQTNYPILSWQ